MNKKITKSELVNWAMGVKAAVKDEAGAGKVTLAVSAYSTYLRKLNDLQVYSTGNKEGVKRLLQMTPEQIQTAYRNALRESARAALSLSTYLKSVGKAGFATRFYNNEDEDDCREIVSIFGSISHVLVFAHENKISIKEAAYECAGLE